MGYNFTMISRIISTSDEVLDYKGDETKEGKMQQARKR